MSHGPLLLEMQPDHNICSFATKCQLNVMSQAAGNRRWLFVKLCVCRAAGSANMHLNPGTFLVLVHKVYGYANEMVAHRCCSTAAGGEIHCKLALACDMCKGGTL